MSDAKQTSVGPNIILVCTGWREMHKLPYAKAAAREWFDYILKHHGPISLVIEGGQRGADTLCRKEAKRRGIPVQTVKANWSIGPKAGPIRNQKMVAMAKSCEVTSTDRVVGLAFLAPQSKGTVDMIDRLVAERWRVEKVHLPGTEAVA